MSGRYGSTAVSAMATWAGWPRSRTSRSIRRMPSTAAPVPASSAEAATRHPTTDPTSSGSVSTLDINVVLRDSVTPSDEGGPTLLLSSDDASPVFVDPSGRRGKWLRGAGAALGVGCVAFAGVIGMSLVGGALKAPHTPVPGASTPSDLGPSGVEAPLHRALPVVTPKPSPTRATTHKPTKNATTAAGHNTKPTRSAR